MNRVKSRSTWRKILPPLGDFMIFFAALATTLLLREPDAFTWMTLATFLPLFAIWMTSIFTVGLYDLRLVRDELALMRNIVVSAGACLILGALYFYAIGTETDLKPKTHLLIAVGLSHFMILLWRKAWLRLLKSDFMDQRLVFLGDPLQLSAIEASMPHHNSDTGLSVVPWQWPGVDIVVVDSIWVDNNWAAASDTLVAAMSSGVPIVTLEEFYESIFGKVSPYYAANPSWALEYVLPNRNQAYTSIKRILDIVGSIVVAIVLAPAMAATALMILIMDGRPVFFTQQRAGLLGKPFTLWKFRTMSHGAEAKGPLLAPDALNSHVTALGDILRRFRLDEFPQLWNVFKGEMSFVGPRPEWMKEVEVLEKVVHSNHLRHLVKPGLTGWAQVKFRQTNTVEDTIERLHYDLYYVKFCSFALDLSILLKTLKRVLISDAHIQAASTPSMPMPANAAWVKDLTKVRHQTHHRRHHDHPKEHAA